ncbi:transcription initiation factor TFIID subunit 4 [Caerostris extrusa]|uniref:Transcription initiation factor TFIID subunit 4 n=1 Tax=Caerostris extrusa TaxID=172846 RepID=A0AAV4XFX6_CAEEX|nr:transcription initiation factor TFIID subunit 4 [Caerostris extrusa]
MATVNSLEDMLSSEVDESVVNALVDSLESHLASSSNVQLSSQEVNTTSVPLNHVINSVLADNNVTRLLDGQKQGVITVTGPSQQTLFTPAVSGNITINRTASNQEIKIVSQAIATQINSTCTINTRSKTAAAAVSSLPNGKSNNTTLLNIRPSQTSSINSIYDLATVTSQQSPINTPSTCITTSTPTSSQIQTTVSNGKQISTTKLQTDSKPSSSEKNNKIVGITRSLDSISVPSTVVQTTVMHPVTTVLQVNNPTIVSKSHVSTSQSVNVVSQVVTPSILSPGVQIVNVNPRLGVQT